MRRCSKQAHSMDEPIRTISNYAGASRFDLAAFERVAILRLDGSSDVSPQRDGVESRALAKTLEDCKLGGEHIAFVHRGDGALGFVFDAFHGVADEDLRGINHGFAGGLAF